MGTHANVVIDPSPASRVTCASRSRSRTASITDAWVSGDAVPRHGDRPAGPRSPPTRSTSRSASAASARSRTATPRRWRPRPRSGITIPNDARIVRNIIEAAQYLHSHILWFYTLTALDYVDPVKALTANIADTYALAAGGRHAHRGLRRRPGQAQDARRRRPALHLHQRLVRPPGVRTGHARRARTSSPSRTTSRPSRCRPRPRAIIAIMGGKFPHFMTSLPGGTAWVPTEEKLDDILFRLSGSRLVHDDTMIPDTLAIAPFYIDALGYGGGHGQLPVVGRLQRRVAWRCQEALPARRRHLRRHSGLTVADADPAKVIEYVEHSWYERRGRDLNPADGRDRPPAVHRATTSPSKYSWAKAPRYDGKPMEVGPLVAHARRVSARRAPQVKTIVDVALATLGAAGKPEVLVSLLGRVAARNLETEGRRRLGARVGQRAHRGASRAATSSFFSRSTADDGEGAGLWEAPRGALGHWMTVKGGKIANYQVVHPVDVEHRPRDADGVRGPHGGGAHRRPGRRPREAAGGAAHRPQLRSLNRLRRSRD